MRSNDILGRLVGLLIVVAGVAMLLMVFQYALKMFTSDTMGLHIPTAVDPKKPAAALNALGVSAILLFARIAVLFLMSIIGSMVTNKGISLMFASRTVVTKEPEP